MRHNYRKIKATAIITAILIVAVVSVAAITMQGYLGAEMNRTRLILDNDELLNRAYDVESWAIARIKKAIRDGKLFTEDNNFKYNNNRYNYIQSGEVISLSQKNNINYLYNTDVCKNKSYDIDADIIASAFKQSLLKQYSLSELSDNDVTTIITNIQQWFCQSSRVEKVEDSGNDLTFAYQRAGQLFTDISELKLIPGVTKEIYKKIVNFATVYPVTIDKDVVMMPVHINNISISMLAGLARVGLDTAQAFLDTIKDIKDEARLTAVVDYLKKTELYSNEQLERIKSEMFTSQPIAEDYFMLVSKAARGDYMAQLNTLVHVDKQKINIIWRKRGLFDE